MSQQQPNVLLPALLPENWGNFTHKRNVTFHYMHFFHQSCGCFRKGFWCVVQMCLVPWIVCILGNYSGSHVVYWQTINQFRCSSAFLTIFRDDCAWGTTEIVKMSFKIILSHSWSSEPCNVLLLFPALEWERATREVMNGGAVNVWREQTFRLTGPLLAHHCPACDMYQARRTLRRRGPWAR